MFKLESYCFISIFVHCGRRHCLLHFWFLFFWCPVWLSDSKGYPYWYHYVKVSQTNKPVLSPMSLLFSVCKDSFCSYNSGIFAFIWSYILFFFKYGIFMIEFCLFVLDPMSVDHVTMLTVALDGKPYLVEINVLSVSKQIICRFSGSSFDS